MHLISFASWKGGSGKSTALMATACSLIAQGTKVALMEADANATLRRWRQNALQRQTWDPACKIYLSDDPKAFETAYEQAYNADTDIALVDTAGGASDLNNTILFNSNAIVIPTALTSFDIDSCIDTYHYAFELTKDETDEIPIAILRQRIPTIKLTIRQQADLQILDALPQLHNHLHQRDAFASLKAIGMFHLVHAALLKNPGKRVEARHIQIAMRESDAVAADLFDLLTNAVPESAAHAR